MNIAKIAVVGGFAVAAALTFPPLAAADDLTTVVSDEISSLNDTFQAETFLTGNYADVVYHTGGLDTIQPLDAPQSGTTFLDYVLYGEADPSSKAPGAYDVFDGAVVEFDDAYNVEAYSMLDDGALVPAADLLSVPGTTTVTDALATDSVQGAFTTFFDQGLTDLLGYVDIFAAI